MIWLKIIALVTAIPLGYLLAWLAKDELKKSRPYFYIIIVSSILSALWFYLTNRTDISLTFLFILITTLVSLTRAKK